MIQGDIQVFTNPAGLLFIPLIAAERCQQREEAMRRGAKFYITALAAGWRPMTEAGGILVA